MTTVVAMIIPIDIIQVLGDFIDPPDLISLSLTSKDNYYKCLSPQLLKRIMKRHLVDHVDPYSLVFRYKTNKYVLKPHINITLEVLFIKYASMYTKIRIECNSAQVTSVPLLPNVEILLLDSNEITELPPFPKVRMLACSRNKITRLKMYPELDTLECQYNQIQEIPNYPKLDVLTAWGNKTIEVPRIPSLGFYMMETNNPVTLRH